MQQKDYWIVGMVIVLAIMGIFFTSFKGMETMEPQVALVHYIEFEGTVVSLLLDESETYNEGRNHQSPNDSAVIRIDKIVETGGFSNLNWDSLGMEEGKEVLLNFRYTARPARVITVVGETKRVGDTVSHMVSPTKITLEDGYFVFRIDGSSKTETTLSGLQKGSRLKVKLWETLEVEKYEIIP